MSNDARRMVVLKAVKFLLTRARDYPVGHERRRKLLQAAKSLLDSPVPGMRRSLPKIGDEDFMPQLTPEALREAAIRGEANPSNPYRDGGERALIKGPKLLRPRRVAE